MANGPPSENPPPLAHTSGYAADCGGRHFSTRPGAALSHVGSRRDRELKLALQPPYAVARAQLTVPLSQLQKV